MLLAGLIIYMLFAMFAVYKTEAKVIVEGRGKKKLEWKTVMDAIGDNEGVMVTLYQHAIGIMDSYGEPTQVNQQSVNSTPPVSHTVWSPPSPLLCSLYVCYRCPVPREHPDLILCHTLGIVNHFTPSQADMI